MSRLDDTQEQIKESILQLEQKYPVDNWIINGIYIWPYIRIRIYLNMLVYSDKMNNTASNPLSTTIKKNVGFNKIATLTKLPFAFFRLQYFYSRLKKKKALLFGSHFHRVLYKGKYFNRFYDSIIENHKLHDDVYMMEYNKVRKPIYNEKAVIHLTERLNDYKLLLKLKRKNYGIETIKLNDYSNFFKELSNYNLNVETLKVSENDLVNWVRKIISLQDFYYRFYRKTEPSKVVFLGYYGYDDLYAALIVANKMNITTVDFQHGPQTNIHMAYASWLKVPETGFNTMPGEFWTWDKKSKDNIEIWSSRIKYLTALVVGQPYIAFSLNNNELNYQEDQNILYTLQVEPIEQLSPKIIELIKKSKYNWNLRLHPRSVTNKEELISFLNANDLFNNFKIQNPIKNPLPQVLTSTVLHITNFSGCLIEAHLMGVPTLIINNVGKEMFQDYIDDKLVFYCNEGEKDFEKKYLNLLKKFEKSKFEVFYSKVPNPITD